MMQQLSNLSKLSGQLPSNTEKNPSYHVNAVTLRSDITYDPPPMVVVDDEEELIEEEPPKEGEKEEQPAATLEKRSPPLMYMYLLFLSHID